MASIAVCTTFPLDYYNLCAREMLATFDAHWPKDVGIFISLDRVSQQDYDAIQNDLNGVMPSGRNFFLSNEWSVDKEAFYKRNTDSPDLPYRFQVCRFAHKVFALYETMRHCQHEYDYLIWLDADVITHKQITHEVLSNDLLPKQHQVVSYLGRSDAPHSECGFVGYNLKTALTLITEMHGYYVSDKVLELPGWTDCDVLDACIKNLKPEDCYNLSEGLKGWHVFPESPCGKYMEHRKGNRKANGGIKTQSQQQVYDASSMQIKTKNCLPNDKIQENIKENLRLIKHWADYVKPHDEQVVVCSAGPSLSYADIKPWADKGVKIVTVKHAIDRLKSWNIKPWACVLLDPRPHVEGFVKKPDKDVIYFVASMVDPSAVKTLLDNDCHVIGYHAFVGAGEDKLLDKGTMLVSGGSATATRSIGLLYECLGFKELHCYGYDLCYFTKPDMNVKNDDGSPKYIEITLAARVWGNKAQNRTFWTEGQFLAQARELHDLYKSQQGFNINLYGFGIAAWQRDCHEQYKAWVDKYNAEIDMRKNHSKSLNEWEYGITGKSIRSTNAYRDGFIFSSNAGDTNSIATAAPAKTS